MDEWNQYTHAQVEAQWKPPKVNYFKINLDASFVKKNKGGWGAICRDDTSMVQFAAAGCLLHITDHLHAKAMALSSAIDVAEHLGVGRVVS